MLLRNLLSDKLESTEEADAFCGAMVTAKGSLEEMSVALGDIAAKSLLDALPEDFAGAGDAALGESKVTLAEVVDRTGQLRRGPAQN